MIDIRDFFRKRWTGIKLPSKKVLGYIVFGLVVFLISLYYTFPVDKLVTIVENKFQQSTSYTLKFDKMDLHYITGLSFENLSIHMDPTTPPLLFFKELETWINPISFLAGGVSMSLNSEGYDGEVDGHFSNKQNQVTLDLNIDDINLAKLDIVKIKWNLILKGLLSSQFSIET